MQTYICRNIDEENKRCAAGPLEMLFYFIICVIYMCVRLCVSACLPVWVHECVCSN